MRGRTMRIWRDLGAGAIFAGATMLVMLSTPVQAVPRAIAVLQGLDKVTARVSTFEAPVGESVRFGALRVAVRHCDRTPPQEAPESAAFLEIDEVMEGEEPTPLFTGWMFASSPGLNALEHPVYDIWVLDCRGAEIEGAEPPPQ